ncbi:MAG: hypothetical protein KDB75_12280, partial [Flavobacteriales bacterium]|nr:hypothetical protein [Flavobacteriales bacterium]
MPTAIKLYAQAHGLGRTLGMVAGVVMLVLFFSLPSVAQISTTYNGSSTFTVPAGVTEVTVECWGGGGRGASRTSNGRGGGGGGGAYASSIIPVVPGNTYTVTVGNGSSGTGAGGDSWFGTSTTILAKGGTSAG